MEWMPLISRSKLLATEGDLAIAEFELLRPEKDTFAVECIHTKNRMVLWRTIRGNLPISEVQWDIESAEAGKSRITLSVQGPGISFRPFSPYKKLLNPSLCMKALERQLSLFLPELATDEGEKIFEIAETTDGLVCWMQGKKYALTPLPEGTHD